MKHLFFIAGILFSSSAMAESSLSPTSLANGVARQTKTPGVDVVEFMDFKCSVKFNIPGKGQSTDSCRAHIVSSNKSATVYEFFFDDIKKDFTLRAEEQDVRTSDENEFFFNVNSIQFFEDDHAKLMQGYCLSNSKTGSSECKVFSDKSEMTVDVSTERATLVYLKVDGKETLTGVDL